MFLALLTVLWACFVLGALIAFAFEGEYRHGPSAHSFGWLILILSGVAIGVLNLGAWVLWFWT